MLSTYLCVTNFQFCERNRVSCPTEILKLSRQYCSYFLNDSEPCSVSQINNDLDKAGYDIQLSKIDFECSASPLDLRESLIVHLQGTEK